MSTLINILSALFVKFAPAGSLISTNVQSAIAELDTRATSLDSGNVKLTGIQVIAGNKTFLGDLTANSLNAALTANTSVLNVSQNAGGRTLQFGSAGLSTNSIATVGSLTNGGFGMLEVIPTASRIGIWIKGASGQTSNLLEARNSSNATLFSVSPSGAIFIADTTTPTNSASGAFQLPGIGLGNGVAFISTTLSVGSTINAASALDVTSFAANKVAGVFRGTTGQVSNIIEARTIGNTTLFSVSPTGAINIADTTISTAPNNGSFVTAGGGGFGGALNVGGNISASAINATGSIISAVSLVGLNCVATTFRGADSSGTNISAANISFRPGSSTGNGTPGILVFQTYDIGISGTIQQNITEKARISGSALLIGTTTDTGEKLQVNGTVKAAQFNLSALNTAPATSASPGINGERRHDGTYDYIYAGGAWKRSPAYTTW